MAFDILKFRRNTHICICMFQYFEEVYLPPSGIISGFFSLSTPTPDSFAIPDEEWPRTNRCLWFPVKEWSIEIDEFRPCFEELPVPSPMPIRVEWEFNEGDEILFLSLSSNIPLDLLLWKIISIQFQSVASSITFSFECKRFTILYAYPVDGYRSSHHGSFSVPSIIQIWSVIERTTSRTYY